MTHDDEHVLPPDEAGPNEAGPGDATTRAELAVLEQALHERFTARTPPDLWPAVAARLAANAAPFAASTSPRMRPWLVAALMLLGVGVVTTLMLWRPAAEPRSPATTPQDPSGTLPTTLTALQEQLATASEIHVQTRAVWSGELGRWVTIPRHGLDAVFEPALYPTLDAEIVVSIRAAIADARLAPGVGGDAAMPTWSHHLPVHTPTGAALLVRLGGDAPPQVGFATPNGPVLLHAPSFPFAALAPVAERTTAATIAAQGLVFGAGGFAAVPTTATQLRVFDVPSAAVGELARYPSVRQLDLTAAPAWHDAAVLRALVPLRLESLTLAPHRLDAAAFPALGALRTLRELFLVDGHPLLHVLERRATTPAPSLADAAVRALTDLTSLRELTLAGGACTDAGLEALAALPIELLCLVDCDAVRGASLAKWSHVRELAVRGGHLDSTAAQHLAGMPKLQKLYLLDAAAGLPLAPFAAHGTLTSLTLAGPFARNELPQLAAAAALRELRLQPTPPFADDELPLLHGLRQLTRLSLAGATAAQRAALRTALPRCQIHAELW